MAGGLLDRSMWGLLSTDQDYIMRLCSQLVQKRPVTLGCISGARRNSNGSILVCHSSVCACIAPIFRPRAASSGRGLSRSSQSQKRPRRSEMPRKIEPGHVYDLVARAAAER